MDDQRFDRLARALAGNARRRTLLRTLAGSAAALLATTGGGARLARAHHAALGAGDACYDSKQCVAADTPLVCADNGFDYDGPLNCCTYVGSRCFNDEGCCGTAGCVGGFCADAPVYLSAGDPCQNSSQCVAADTSLYCDYVANTDDYRCCALQGSRCAHNRGCCGTLQCVNGFCG
jgi:hypothetical protein